KPCTCSYFVIPIFYFKTIFFITNMLTIWKEIIVPNSLILLVANNFDVLHSLVEREYMLQKDPINPSTHLQVLQLLGSWYPPLKQYLFQSILFYQNLRNKYLPYKIKLIE
uniref:Uncharacterized protein n=1 Tax=Strongyloides stercoralis TaxID=6248 RepID=A0AAF5DF05_STRER